MSILDVIVPGIDQSAANPADAASQTGPAQPSGADAALFLALLQGSGVAPQPVEAPQQGFAVSPEPQTALEQALLRSARLGKSLPELVPEAGSPVPDSGGSLPEEKLEDFAVDLGIDRDLARLLLSQTLPAAPLQPSPVPAPPVATAPVAVRAAATTAQALAGWFKCSESNFTPVPAELQLDMGQFDDPDLSTPAVQPDRETPIQQWLQGTQLPTVAGNQPATTSMVLPGPIGLGPVHISVAPALQPSQTPVIERPTAATLVAQVVSQPPLADEDILRWRATASRGKSAIPTSVSAAAAIEQPDSLTSQPAALEANWTETLSRGRFKSITETAVEPSGQQETAIQALAPDAAPARSRGDGLPPPAPAGTANVDQFSVARQAAPSQPAAVQTSPIKIPGAELNYEDRSAAFAEQVGRRIMDTIRTERWEVNLKLDPEHLGPLDIRLNVDGRNINAVLDVHSAEVQNLLQQGLPKLRDHFEASGYALNAWSFGSSGAGNSASPKRENAAAQSPRAIAAAGRLTARPAEVAASTPQTFDSTASAIDLFV